MNLFDRHGLTNRLLTLNPDLFHFAQTRIELDLDFSVRVEGGDLQKIVRQTFETVLRKSSSSVNEFELDSCADNLRLVDASDSADDEQGSQVDRRDQPDRDLIARTKFRTLEERFASVGPRYRVRLDQPENKNN